MIKIDLITGFLGSGKTTFIKKYAEYLLSIGQKIAILENDFGAINVDLMILSNLEKKGVWLEMVSGGGDYDCHMRRFKTKLIALAMRGFDRVIVEPSGIYDPDEFFDTINDEPLSSWYEPGNIYTIVDSGIDNDLSNDSRYFLACQLCAAGKVIISKSDICLYDENKILNILNESLEYINSDRRINKNDIEILNNLDFNKIYTSGYNTYGYIKKSFDSFNEYSSNYYMNTKINTNNASDLKELFNKSFGDVKRIKGFFNDNGWYLINMTATETNIEDTHNGQNVIIVIGENINKAKIDEYMKKYLC